MRVFPPLPRALGRDALTHALQQVPVVVKALLAIALVAGLRIHTLALLADLRPEQHALVDVCGMMDPWVPSHLCLTWQLEPPQLGARKGLTAGGSKLGGAGLTPRLVKGRGLSGARLTQPAPPNQTKPGGGAGLTTVGWDAVVDNVVVLRVTLSIWTEAVKLSCGVREAVGREEGTTERAPTDPRAQVGALRLLSQLPKGEPVPPFGF